MRQLLGEVLYRNISDKYSFSDILEIRIRSGRKIMLRTLDGIHFLEITADADIINSVIANATHNSLYAYESEISSGFIGYKNGIRIGLTGKGNITENRLIAYKDFYSLCIRIPHQIFGVHREINRLLEDFDNTLIVSPPGGGKTTLCREMARLLSNSYNTLVIDERYELCGADFTMKMGEMCDVIAGIPKSLVYENIIRSMAPELIVCDELFDDSDFEAIRRITLSGIKCLATYHAETVNNVPPELLRLFSYCVVLNSIPKPGSIQSITRRTDV